MDPRVLDAMLPYMVDKYGNPHSRTHAYGWESEDSVEIARKQVPPPPLPVGHPFPSALAVRIALPYQSCFVIGHMQPFNIKSWRRLMMMMLMMMMMMMMTFTFFVEPGVTD
jgi:hypothetical protein